MQNSHSNTAKTGLYIALLGAVLMGGLVYATALDNPFVYDDYLSVVQNPSIHPPLYLRSVLLYRATRPLVNASYAIDRAVWGPDPFGFHLTSVLLHMLNVGLLFVLGMRVASDGQEVSSASAKPAIVGFASAVLFAVHPLMTEAVGYISGRSEVLCATFLLVAILAARNWMRHGGMRWWGLMFVSWLAALATKEIAAMLPLLLFCYDRLVLRGSAAELRRRLVRLHLPLFAIAAVGAAFRIAVFLAIENRNPPSFHWQYGLVELEVTLRYLMLMAVPTNQSIFHQIMPIDGMADARAWLAIGGIGAIVYIFWYARRFNALATFGMFWFLVLLVPPAVLVMLDRGEPMAEHRVYVAACGLFLTAGTTAAWLVARIDGLGRRVTIATYAFFAVAILSLCGHTLVRNAIWGDPVMLWVEAVQGAPQHWRAWLLLGEALYHADRREEGVAAYKHALELRPQELGGYVKLARYQTELGHLEEATQTYERLQLLDPDSSIASTGLGTVAMMSGRPEEAKRHFLRSLDLYPQDVVARESLAQVEAIIAQNPSKPSKHESRAR